MCELWAPGLSWVKALLQDRSALPLSQTIDKAWAFTGMEWSEKNYCWFPKVPCPLQWVIGSRQGEVWLSLPVTPSSQMVRWKEVEATE